MVPTFVMHNAQRYFDKGVAQSLVSTMDAKDWINAALEVCGGKVRFTGIIIVIAQACLEVCYASDRNHLHVCLRTLHFSRIEKQHPHVNSFKLSRADCLQACSELNFFLWLRQGGGKPDRAQGLAKDAANFDEAVASAAKFAASKLG
jgi:hypothetical protein